MATGNSTIASKKAASTVTARANNRASGGEKRNPVARKPATESAKKKRKTTTDADIPPQANPVTVSRLDSGTEGEKEPEQGSHTTETPLSGLQPVRLLQRGRDTEKERAEAEATLLEENKPGIAIFRRAVQLVLFPKVKFITSMAMLDYSHKVTQTILEKFTFQTEAEKIQYWNDYRSKVNRALGDKRGNVNNEMKKAFMSKCYIRRW